MIDNIQKIKDWISKEQEGLMDAQGNFEYPEHEGAYHILCNLDTYIDSLQEEPVNNGLDLGCGVIWKDEEPVSEDLEEAIDTYLATYFDGEKEKQDWPFLKKMAIYFAKWQKEQFEKEYIDLNRGLVCAKGVAVRMAYEQGKIDAKKEIIKGG